MLKNMPQTIITVMLHRNVDDWTNRMTLLRQSMTSTPATMPATFLGHQSYFAHVQNNSTLQQHFPSSQLSPSQSEKKFSLAALHKLKHSNIMTRNNVESARTTTLPDHIFWNAEMVSAYVGSYLFA